MILENLRAVLMTAGGKRRQTFKWYQEIIMPKKLQPWTNTVYHTFTGELEDSLERINEGPGAWLTNSFDGLRAVEMAHAVHHSSATFETVTLEPAP